jgi:twinkle protein
MANVFTLDDIDFAAYEQETDAQRKVLPASLWVQKLIDRIETPVKVRQRLLPWKKTHGLAQFRPGEVTVWAGANGNGKSMVTGMVALSLCAQGEKVCIASFEMKPERTLERMGRQFSGMNPEAVGARGSDQARRKLIDVYEQFRDWTDDKLWLYDQQGTVDWLQVCAVARYAAKVLGVTQIFIDSLMKCVQGEDDYNGQKAFVDQLTSIARDCDVHIHLVHHIKKPANEDHAPNKYDLKGSGAISDQPDNIVLVWRNKPKERKREEGKLTPEEDARDPDAILIWDKQRNGEWEGRIGLWFDKASQQYLGLHGAEPLLLYIDPNE